MYIPKRYEENNVAHGLAVIKEHPFGLLISNGAESPLVTHVPFLWEERSDGNYLLAHIARANPHWQSFAQDAAVTVVFQGPHAYISPSWYDKDGVPTWNYQATHVTGTITIVDGEELERHLRLLMNTFESGVENGRSFDAVDAQMRERLQKGVVGFEIKVHHIEMKAKWSQNKSEEVRNRIIKELGNGSDADRLAAEAMARYYDADR